MKVVIMQTIGDWTRGNSTSGWFGFALAQFFPPFHSSVLEPDLKGNKAKNLSSWVRLPLWNQHPRAPSPKLFGQRLVAGRDGEETKTNKMFGMAACMYRNGSAFHLHCFTTKSCG